MYDKALSTQYIYLHPESQNLLQEDNSHVTSIFSFYFLDKPENLKYQDEYYYLSHGKIVLVHKR